MTFIECMHPQINNRQSADYLAPIIDWPIIGQSIIGAPLNSSTVDATNSQRHTDACILVQWTAVERQQLNDSSGKRTNGRTDMKRDIYPRTDGRRSPLTSSRRCGRWSGSEAGKLSSSACRRGVADVGPSEAAAEPSCILPRRRETHAPTEADCQSTATP